MKKILFIEDNAEIVALYEPKLKEAGFDVKTALDGEHGLQYALEDHPDLILLDVVMPDMDGMNVMQRIRQEGEWGKGVPIIIFTNFDVNDERLKRVVQDKPAYYLLKANYTPHSLVAKLKEFVAAH